MSVQTVNTGGVSRPNYSPNGRDETVRRELSDPQETAQSGVSANEPVSRTSSGGLDEAIKAAKIEDDKLAATVADSHVDIGWWKWPSDKSSVGQWLKLYNKSWNSEALQTWVKAQNLVPDSLRLRGSTLTAQKRVDGKLTAVKFTPSDKSGWWPLGRQAIESAAMLDPQRTGLAGNGNAKLSPKEVMAFYGGTWPINTVEARELKRDGFPAVNAADNPTRGPMAQQLTLRQYQDTEQESALIKTLLGAIKDKPDDEKIDLGTIRSDIVPGSSLASANSSKPELLKKLRQLPQMASILLAHQADWYAPTRLVDGQLFIKSRGKSGTWKNVTAQVRANAVLAPLLDNAIEKAKSTGGIINSGARADAVQMLRASGLDDFPSTPTVKELRNLINWKLNPIPPGSSLGSYGREYLTDSETPSADHRHRVRRTATDNDPDAKLTLFDCSPKPWAGKTLEQIRKNADKLIAQALSQGEGLARSQTILTRFDGELPFAIADATPGDRQQLLMLRDMLRVDIDLGKKRNLIAGYNLYSASNAGKKLSEVRDELEKHISVTKKLPMEQAVLMTHALLATVAPEFLVKGAGAERVGSLTHVNLRIQTALVEMASQGSSREMDVAQVSSRSVLTPITSSHEELQTALSAGPIYDWALAQGLVTAEDDYSESAVKRALTSYNQRLENYSAMNSDLDSARMGVISRSEMAKQALEKVSPGNENFFSKRIIYAEPDSLIYKTVKAVKALHPLVPDGTTVDGKSVSTAEHAVGTHSILDLYMSGVLTAKNVDTVQWKFASAADRLKFESLKSQLSKLEPLGDVFDDVFNDGTQHLEKFVLQSARVIMSHMPLEDRVRLEFGEVFVVGASPYQLSDGSKLSQAQAQQKMGPLIYAKDTSGDQCYEMLPSGEGYVLRPEYLPAMRALADHDKKWVRVYKNSYPELPADLDILSYFPADKQDRSESNQVPNTFSSKRTDELIKTFKDNQLFLNRKLMLESARGVTTNEAIQKRFEAAESFIINTIIPFKSNIEDLASGDPKRMAMGAIGLGLEIFGALFVVAGAVGAAAKAATTAAKLAQYGRAALSMFNLPGAVIDTSKALYRLTSIGVRSIGTHAPKALAKGVSNFRSLASSAGKSNHGYFRNSFKPWTTNDTVGLLSNTGLINTGIGTEAYVQQPPPVPSQGTAVTV